jgi:type III pantothenate kinase
MTTALLMDVGNTRLKWAVLRDGTLGRQQAELYADWNDEQFRSHVVVPAGRVDRILVANVGGEGIESLICGAAHEAWGLHPVFLRASARGGGIENGYVDPAKLGVDRWAAMIGAVSMGLGPVCVVSVGTAMTVDGVTETGRHLGGLIVPGPDLMITSLMRNTSDIASRVASDKPGEALFADSTWGGVYQGAVHALAALVDCAMVTMAQSCGKRPVLVTTGGAAHCIERIVAHPSQQVPDLVLRGVAVLASEI